MLRNGLRYCEMCDKEITKGAEYFAALVERDYFPLNANAAGSGLTVDALGNVRLDICLDCRASMNRLSGEERIS